MIYHVARQEIINSNQLTNIIFFKLNSKHVQYSLKIGLIIIYVYHEKNIKHPLTKFKTNSLQPSIINYSMSLCNTLRHLMCRLLTRLLLSNSTIPEIIYL